EPSSPVHHRQRSTRSVTSAGTSGWPSRRSTTCSGYGGTRLPRASRPAPIVAALAAGDDEANELRALLFEQSSTHANGKAHGPAAGLPNWAPVPAKVLTPEEVARATWLVEACGGREWTAARAKAYLDAGLGSLERARLSAVPRRELADLAVYAVERES